MIYKKHDISLTVQKGKDTMRVIFVTGDRFPKEGACTGLLKNLFFKGGLLEQCTKIDVLVADNLYSEIQAENYNGITVYHHNCLQKISVHDYKRIFFRHPIVTIIGVLSKAISKIRKTIVDPINCKNIERTLNKICPNNHSVFFCSGNHCSCFFRSDSCA